MKYSIIESVFLGDYKSIVELELFTSSFFFFNGIPHPPPNTALIKHSFCSFFPEMEVHWWQEKYLGISVLNFTFLQLF